jgi:hypothetical protein
LLKCSSLSRAGSKLHFGRLNVYGPPVVRPFPDKVKAVEGKPFSLICPVGGFPIHEVVWKKGQSYVFLYHTVIFHLQTKNLVK